MKKLQIPIDDELMKETKMYAFTNGITLKEVVISALKSYITSTTDNSSDTTTTTTTTNSTTNSSTTNTDNTDNTSSTSNDDIDHLFYVLRKTAKVGRPIKDFKQYTDNGAQWVILDGCRPHYDKDGNLIPFRYTNAEGVVVEPDTEDLSYLADCYGKQVMVEE